MTVILSEEDVVAALDMGECIDALESAFRSLAEGRAVNRPRSHTYLEQGEGRHYLFKTMDGGVPELGVHCLRLSSDIIQEVETSAGNRRTKVPAAPGGAYVGLVMLFDIATLVPLAIMPDGYLQRMRVGATSALAARFLARESADTAAIIGTGWQAGAQLLALNVVRPLREVAVYSSNPDNVSAFIDELGPRTGLVLRRAVSVEDAVSGAGVISLATNSLSPVLHASALSAGQHVGSVQGHELGASVFGRADVIGVRSLEPSTYHHAPGRAPTEVANEPELDAAVAAKMVQLGDIIVGSGGRTSDDQVTLFTGSHSGASSGLGIQFAAVAAAVHRRAVSLGLGRTIPTEWFTQLGRP